MDEDDFLDKLSQVSALKSKIVSKCDGKFLQPSPVTHKKDRGGVQSGGFVLIPDSVWYCRALLHFQPQLSQTLVQSHLIVHWCKHSKHLKTLEMVIILIVVIILIICLIITNCISFRIVEIC